MEKKNLRAKLQRKLNEIDQRMYRLKSDAVHQVLFQSDYWQSSSCIGITISRFPEVDTYKIIKRAWAEGKRIVAPRCISSNHTLEFYLIQNFDEVEPTFYGLLEPFKHLPQVDSNHIDLMIVPGLAYTREGFRLGYGGGYYDRLLANYKGVTLSLVFKEQIMDRIPIDQHDVPVQVLVTEDETM